MRRYDTPLERAHRHVQDAEHRVREQAERIENMRSAGHDTRTAEEMLLVFEQALEIMRAHRAFVEHRERGHSI